MIEEGGSRDCPITEFKADEEAGPILATSDTEDVHNPFVIRDGGHSAMIDVVCASHRIPTVLQKTYPILRCVLIPCCDSSLSTYRKCIDKYIGANFKPGHWIDGGCYQFDPVRDPDETCDERTQAASRSFPPPASQLGVARHKANSKRKRHSGSNKEPTAKAKEPDAEAKTTAPRTANDKQKGDGSIGEPTAKDKAIALRLIEQLVEGIQQAMKEDLNPATQKRPDDSLAQYRHERREADDEGELEHILWERAADAERGGKESAWVDRLMFSACRSYRRAEQRKILVNTDPAMDLQQRRWEVGGQVLSNIVDGLYAFRGPLALVVYRAAQKKNMHLHSCTPLSEERRAGIAKAVVEALRFTPITAALHSRVMLPPAYLSYRWGLEYSEVCTSLKLANFADLKFTESELAGCAWEMPLSFLIRKPDSPGTVRIVEKNGVQLLTDSIVNPIAAGGEVPLTNKGGQAAPNATARPVEATSTAQFKPVNKRQRTEQYNAGEVCRRNSGGAAEASPPHVHLTTSAGEEGDVRSIDRAENGEQHHHSSQLPGVGHADVPVSTALVMHNCTAVPVDSAPGAGSGEAGPPCHGQESAAFMSDAQGSQTPHVEAAAGKASSWVNHRDDLRRSSPSNIGANSSPATESASRGWEESRTTIFQAVNANGMTISKGQEADELYQGTSDGILAAREAASLYLLADAAGRGHEERRSAEAAPTLGPTEQILPHNPPAVVANSEQAAGDGFPLLQSDEVDLDLGSYGAPTYLFDFNTDEYDGLESVDDVFNLYQGV